MKDEIKINKANKSLTFINNGIAFSQFRVADEILDLITNLQQENERLSDKIEFYEDVDSDRCAYNEELQEENEHLKENNQNMQEEMARVWKENERLKAKYDNNKSHEINYKYFTTLYSKATKDIVIDDLVYKCEDLDNLKQSYEKLYIEKEDYKSRCEKAIEYNYELQERYCHSAIFDELVASKVYEITEKELNILQNGSDEK